MDFTLLQNIITISEEKNITQAARKLFISQSALNQQLLNLEKELGTRLFIRDRQSWAITEAGYLYIEAARQILDIKRFTYSKISDFTNTQNEVINVNATVGFGDRMMPYIYRKFYSDYPDVRLNYKREGSLETIKLVKNGDVDIGFISSSSEMSPSFVYHVIAEPEFEVVLRKNSKLARQLGRDYAPHDAVNISLFKNMPFVLGRRDTVDRICTEEIFERAGFKPAIFGEFDGDRYLATVVATRDVCAIICEHHLDELPDDVVSFRLTSHPKMQIAAVHSPTVHMSRAKMWLIELGEEYWSNILKPNS